MCMNPESILIEDRIMGVSIHIPTPLRSDGTGPSMVQAAGQALEGALESLLSSCPDLARHRRFVSVPIQDEGFRFQQGEKTPVHAGSERTILPPVPGV
jgi:molybdopterin converting factor small subunit